jgi:hypothetical protein
MITVVTWNQIFKVF